uniref:Glycosyl transferase, group 2 family protein n=1 Tax=Xanthomonas citri pv. punicae TaxID=487838 RepID=A0A088FN26_XANCI|nr:glycosyl transferase, group 2 family protein [Xanthomonas citri pv. punicae]
MAAYASGGSAPAPQVSLDAYESWHAALPQLEVSADSGMISVIIPVCNTPELFLREAIESVRTQTYQNWEICIHDDASDEPHVGRILAECKKHIPNLWVTRSETRSGIAATTNAALASARGRWVTFLDHDDVLDRNALAAVVDCHIKTGSAVVYTDHDMLGEDGRLRNPYFKPDWNYDLFLAQMYLGHLVSFEHDLIKRVGLTRSECDGSQDYDLVLRCVAAGAKVGHVPRVLYHWRMHAGSTAANADSKPYAHDSGKRAIQYHVDAVYPGAQVEDGPHLFCYDVRYPYAQHAPKASIIIPTRDGLDLLRPCIESIQARTDYTNFEIIVVDNGSKDPATLEWLDAMSNEPWFRVLQADVPFNWSALNNLAAASAEGEVLVFLNNDTEVASADWLQRLVENALRPDVGACGALLLYADGSIQHAGVVVGMGGWADHVFKGQQPIHHQHLFVSPILRREVLAVTGACVAISRANFDAISGFDESFVVCGSDVELCLRAMANGKRTVYVPEAILIHHESKTRDPRVIPESDFVRSAQAYSPYRESGDPFYSPNLDYMSPSPALRGAQADA